MEPDQSDRRKVVPVDSSRLAVLQPPEMLLERADQRAFCLRDARRMNEDLGESLHDPQVGERAKSCSRESKID